MDDMVCLDAPLAHHHYRLTPPQFKFKLTSVMIVDFVGCWVIEKLCKYLFADLEPKALITRGRERREARRAEENRLAADAAVEKKTQ